VNRPAAAVVFDVDGVLLDLTPAEEDAFFAPFETLYGITGLSRDWDSYRVRNDEDSARHPDQLFLAPGHEGLERLVDGRVHGRRLVVGQQPLPQRAGPFVAVLAPSSSQVS
jgi:FMN phosphatase YigB (HAD superfamily)